MMPAYSGVRFASADPAFAYAIVRLRTLQDTEAGTNDSFQSVEVSHDIA